MAYGSDDYAMFFHESSDSSDSSESDTDYTPEEPPHFVSDKAQRQFDRSIFRHVFVEREFTAPSPPFEEAIRFYKWEPLTIAPSSSNVEIAKEFYANANISDSNKVDHKGVYLRGTYLKMTSHIINQHYRLPDYPEEEFKQLAESSNIDHLIESLGLPRAVWVCNARSDPIYMCTSDLTAEARMWLLLINSRLMPTKQTTKATRERVLLIYAIQHRMTIDVGRVIIWYINRAQWSEATPMFFLLLLSEMAQKHKIEVDPTENCRHSLGTIGRPQWWSYCETEHNERLRRNTLNRAVFFPFLHN